MAGTLRMRMFGPFTVARDGDAGDAPDDALAELRHHRMATQLLALLAVHAGRPVEKSDAAVQLWGAGASEANLNKAVQALRAALGPDGGRLVSESGRLCLDLGGVDVDALALRDAWERRAQGADALRLAVERCEGPFLQGWDAPWAIEARRLHGELLRQALHRLARAALASGQLPPALRFLAHLRRTGDFAEAAHVQLMRACMEAKAFATAAQLYGEYRDFLRDHDHLLMPEEMTALHARIPRAAADVVPPLDPDDLALEPPGGGMPLDSPLYVCRPADHEFHAALARRDGIVRLRGPRQVGKTSLLARGLEHARQSGAQVVVTDFQKLAPQDTASAEALFRALARALRSRLKTPVGPDECWDPLLSANANFEAWLRDEVLERTELPVVWGVDEADALFGRDYADSVFGLFRSWYNERSLDPAGPWRRFTLILTYSTEARLFIANLNQSPFNVGTRVALGDFTPEEAAELNARYGAPLSPEELARVCALVGGHPYLLGRCLHAVRARGLDAAALWEEAEREGGLFSEHLAHIEAAITADAALRAGLVALLRGEENDAAAPPGSAMTQDAFSRLRAAGVVAGDSARAARPRCRLYERYLRERLGAAEP